jgi:phenylalanyl-tRNA synthetase alpha chain
MQDQIEKIKIEALEEIKKAKDADALFDVEKKYLGRKSAFVEILKNLKNLSAEDKKAIGSLANQIKNSIEAAIAQKRKEIARDKKEEKFNLDVTIPGKKARAGHLHIITQVQREIEDIFTSMGFEIAEGPEVEEERYNFDALNIPLHHPARDMQDTFWLRQTVKSQKLKVESERLSLRSQTSAVQVRYMEKHKPPLRIIVPGKCFRNEAVDSTHEHTFYQFEALVVGEDINVGHLKKVAEQFFSEFFKKDVRVRLRPSFFPFTEPSFEFDISCLVCNGDGCSACRHGKWLELGGAGMVNQNVFMVSGYPRNEYQGFAWGFGLERLAMMKYKIDHVKWFYGGDLRFIKQF